MHGGVALDDIKKPNADGLRKGFKNLDKHVRNMQSFGQTVVVCFNRYAFDTDEEMEIVRQHCKEIGVAFAENNAFMEGGTGAVELANVVVEQIANSPSEPVQFQYNDDDDVKTKVEKVARQIYGAGNVVFQSAALTKLKMIESLGYADFPVCIAKTQYSFSDDATKYGVPENFEFTIRDFVISAGAEMIVAIAGDIMRMPGLPKVPQAQKIDVVNGEITGLS
jgi:formate--tetrahydrofolate ligase